MVLKENNHMNVNIDAIKLLLDYQTTHAARPVKETSNFEEWKEDIPMLNGVSESPKAKGKKANSSKSPTVKTGRRKGKIREPSVPIATIVAGKKRKDEKDVGFISTCNACNGDAYHSEDLLYVSRMFCSSIDTSDSMCSSEDFDTQSEFVQSSLGLSGNQASPEKSSSKAAQATKKDSKTDSCTKRFTSKENNVFDFTSGNKDVDDQLMSIYSASYLADSQRISEENEPNTVVSVEQTCEMDISSTKYSGKKVRFAESPSIKVYVKDIELDCVDSKFMEDTSCSENGNLHLTDINKNLLDASRTDLKPAAYNELLCTSWSNTLQSPKAVHENSNCDLQSTIEPTTVSLSEGSNKLFKLSFTEEKYLPSEFNSRVVIKRQNVTKQEPSFSPDDLHSNIKTTEEKEYHSDSVPGCTDLSLNTFQQTRSTASSETDYKPTMQDESLVSESSDDNPDDVLNIFSKKGKQRRKKGTKHNDFFPLLSSSEDEEPITEIIQNSKRKFIEISGLGIFAESNDSKSKRGGQNFDGAREVRLPQEKLSGITSTPQRTNRNKTVEKDERKVIKIKDFNSEKSSARQDQSPLSIPNLSEKVLETESGKVEIKSGNMISQVASAQASKQKDQGDQINASYQRKQKAEEGKDSHSPPIFTDLSLSTFQRTKSNASSQNDKIPTIQDDLRVSDSSDDNDLNDVTSILQKEGGQGKEKGSKGSDFLPSFSSDDDKPLAEIVKNNERKFIEISELDIFNETNDTKSKPEVQMFDRAKEVKLSPEFLSGSTNVNLWTSMKNETTEKKSLDERRVSEMKDLKLEEFSNGQDQSLKATETKLHKVEISNENVRSEVASSQFIEQNDQEVQVNASNEKIQKAGQEKEHHTDSSSRFTDLSLSTFQQTKSNVSCQNYKISTIQDDLRVSDSSDDDDRNVLSIFQKKSRQRKEKDSKGSGFFPSFSSDDNRPLAEIVKNNKRKFIEISELDIFYETNDIKSKPEVQMFDRAKEVKLSPEFLSGSTNVNLWTSMKNETTEKKSLDERRVSEMKDLKLEEFSNGQDQSLKATETKLHKVEISNENVRSEVASSQIIEQNDQEAQVNASNEKIQKAGQEKEHHTDSSSRFTDLSLSTFQQTKSNVSCQNNKISTIQDDLRVSDSSDDDDRNVLSIFQKKSRQRKEKDSKGSDFFPSFSSDDDRPLAEIVKNNKRKFIEISELDIFYEADDIKSKPEVQLFDRAKEVKLSQELLSVNTSVHLWTSMKNETTEKKSLDERKLSEMKDLKLEKFLSGQSLKATETISNKVEISNENVRFEVSSSQISEQKNKEAKPNASNQNTQKDEQEKEHHCDLSSSFNNLFPTTLQQTSNSIFSENDNKTTTLDDSWVPDSCDDDDDDDDCYDVLNIFQNKGKQQSQQADNPNDFFPSVSSSEDEEPPIDIVVSNQKEFTEMRSLNVFSETNDIKLKPTDQNFERARVVKLSKEMLSCNTSVPLLLNKNEVTEENDVERKVINHEDFSWEMSSAGQNQSHLSCATQIGDLREKTMEEIGSNEVGMSGNIMRSHIASYQFSKQSVQEVHINVSSQKEQKAEQKNTYDMSDFNGTVGNETKEFPYLSEILCFKSDTSDDVCPSKHTVFVKSVSESFDNQNSMKGNESKSAITSGKSCDTDTSTKRCASWEMASTETSSTKADDYNMTINPPYFGCTFANDADCSRADNTRNDLNKKVSKTLLSETSENEFSFIQNGESHHGSVCNTGTDIKEHGKSLHQDYPTSVINSEFSTSVSEGKQIIPVVTLSAESKEHKNSPVLGLVNVSNIASFFLGQPKKSDEDLPEIIAISLIENDENTCNPEERDIVQFRTTVESNFVNVESSYNRCNDRTVDNHEKLHSSEETASADTRTLALSPNQEHNYSLALNDNAPTEWLNVLREHNYCLLDNKTSIIVTERTNEHHYSPSNCDDLSSEMFHMTKSNTTFKDKQAISEFDSSNYEQGHPVLNILSECSNDQQSKNNCRHRDLPASISSFENANCEGNDPQKNMEASRLSLFTNAEDMRSELVYLDVKEENRSTDTLSVSPGMNVSSCTAKSMGFKRDLMKGTDLTTKNGTAEEDELLLSGTSMAENHRETEFTITNTGREESGKSTCESIQISRVTVSQTTSAFETELNYLEPVDIIAGNKRRHTDTDVSRKQSASPRFTVGSSLVSDHGSTNSVFDQISNIHSLEKKDDTHQDMLASKDTDNIRTSHAELERTVNSLCEENAIIKKNTALLQEKVERLERELHQFNCVYKNGCLLGKLLDAMPMQNRQTVSDNLRIPRVERGHGQDPLDSKTEIVVNMVQDVMENGCNCDDDFGLCLHINSKGISLKFCDTCKMKDTPR